MDIFKDVQINCDGWNDFGEIVDISTENCESLVRENVTFTLAEDYKELSNGDMVTIIAEYEEKIFSENGFKVSNDSAEIRVNGLRQIVDAQDYHDGMAWVNVEFADETKWCCCDKEGEILFSLEAGSIPTTYFANGVAIVDYNRVIDKSGNVIWSIVDNGISASNELWGMVM